MYSRLNKTRNKENLYKNKKVQKKEIQLLILGNKNKLNNCFTEVLKIQKAKIQDLFYFY